MGLFSWLTKGDSPRAESPAEEPQTAVETVEELGEALSAANGAVRVDATRILLERWRGGDAAAAEALVSRLSELLQDDEPQVRIAALSAVRMMRKPENLAAHQSAILALLADRVAQVRSAAVWTAARLRAPEARQQVRALLQSTEEPMRFAAACALSDQRDSAALPELTAALREEHRRQEALSAILSLGDPAAVPALTELFEDESLGEFDRTMTAAALARLGDSRGAAYLVERISSDGDDRPIAAEWAGRLHIGDATAVLEELADAAGDPARGAALRALGRLGASGAEDRLLAVARSEHEAEDLRMDAAEGLAEVGSARALETLRELARSEGELGVLCAELLAEIAANAAEAAASGTDSQSTPSAG